MSERDDRSRACAVCGRILDYQEGHGWLHLITPADDDHVVVPVRPSEIKPEYHCDFCYALDPGYVLPVSDFASVDYPGVCSDGDWSACAPCAELLERNRWNLLLLRVLRSWGNRHGFVPPELESQLRRHYRELRKHIRGAVRPI